MVRCRRAGVRTPTIYFVDDESCCIFMEYISGITLKEFIFTHGNDQGIFTLSITLIIIEVLHLCQQVGTIIAKLHDANLVHGDLTTSNFLVEDQTHQLVSHFSPYFS